MATVILVQTDTAPTCTAAELCSGLSDAQGPIEQFATLGGSAGSAEDGSGNFPNASALVRRTLYFDCPGDTGWTTGAGTWVVRVNVSSGNAVIRLMEIHICRVNSSCANQETIGSLTGLNQATNVAQPMSNNVSGSAVTLAAGDRIMVIVGFDNTADHGNQAIGVTPSVNIDTPWDDGVAGGHGRLVSDERNRLAA